jgi:CRP-like cAMP-binding protein
MQDFPKGRIIYDAQQPNRHLFAVILGRVKVIHTAEDGCQTITRIVRTDDLFGESSLVGAGTRAESAMALDAVTLMAWSRMEIEQNIENNPRLGIALWQYLTRQGLKMQDRIESMAARKTPERVMLGLLQLAGDLGVATADGGLRLGALPHHTIAEFVGTSREIVTYQMNQLRRRGLITYSRKHIEVKPLAMKETLLRPVLSATA